VNAAGTESNDPALAGTLLRKALQGAIDETGAESPASSCARIALAGSERLRGNLDAAGELYRGAALRLTGRSEHQLDLAFAWLGIARVAAAQHHPREARQAYEKALSAMTAAVTENHPFVALILWELSSLDDAGFTAEKRAALAKHARDVWDRVAPFREGRTMTAERVRAMLSGYQRLQEISDCAARLNTTRMERDTPPGNRVQLATNLYQSGTGYFLYGAGSQGIPWLLRSLAFFREAFGERHPYLLNVLRDLTYAEIQAKQITAGLAHAREATALADARIGTFNAPEEALREQALQRAVYLNHLELLFEKGGGAEAAESFIAGQRARTSSTALTLQASAARSAAGDPRIAALVREFQDRAAQLGKIDADLLTAAGRKPEERDLLAESRMRGERTAGEEALLQLRRELEQRAPAYAETVFPRPLPLDAAKALLQRDEALLALVSGPRFTFAWLVRHDSVEALRLPAQRRDWDEIVARFRRALDVANVRRQSMKDPAHPAFDVQTGARIYRELLEPFERRLNGVRHLIIVPDGPLETVPFAALVTAPAPDTTPLPKIPWLARRHAISVIPAVSSLKSLRAQPPAQAPHPFVGFGNPLRSHASPAASDLDRMRALRQQSDLQETRAELATIGAAFGANESALHFGTEVSEEAVKAFPLSMYRVVAFSTHASLGRGATEPSLLLASSVPGDGRLTTSEIAELKLDADLVLLLGCDTAAADGTPDAEGFSGLTRAFLYAGTRAVFVSHWAIPSEETVILTSAMFSGAESQPDIGLAEVLRRAMLAMIDDAERPELAHPVYWAPFVLVGDGNRLLFRHGSLRDAQ
jgi:CHAT domain-containing protein